MLCNKLGFKSTTHEPCLYCGIFKNKEVLFLCQVDDFAVASANDEINESVIKVIDNKFKIKIKDLGLLQQYNGVDVHQTKHYVKLNNAT